MTITAIVLLTVSAVFHVAWNLGGMTAGPSPRFFRLATGYGTLLALPAMVYGLPMMYSVRSDIVLFVLLSGLFQAVYFTGLSAAYTTGHLSVAYPLARTWPALFVLLVSILRGHGDAITWKVTAGIALILTGSMVLPLANLRELRISASVKKSCAFALVAAVGTAGYTITDDAALRILTPATELPGWLVACVWLGYESLAAVTWLWIFWRLRILQVAVETPFKFSHRRAMLVALAMSCTYALVLASYPMVADVSYAAGFRQLSVPLGAIAGVVILREPGPPSKMFAVVLMFIGVVFVALG